MTTLMQASRQWATRPMDERFVNLFELAAKTAHIHTRSRAPVVASRDITVRPDPQDNLKGIQIVGRANVPYTPTNWSFGQLASLAGAPAGYLRKLPAPLVADNMNYGLKIAREVEDVGLLITQENDQTGTLRAATGPKYGRIWNRDIVEALIEQYGDGLTGKFRVPGEFGKAVPVTKANTTLYAGDRNMFVFLADEENRVEIPNRRNGQSGSLARGFFIWNSEVGSDTCGAALFLFDYVCCNRIVWGAQDVVEMKIRHTASAPHRWIEEIQPALREYADSTTGSVVETVKEAQRKRVDDDLEKFLAKRFGARMVESIKAIHQVEEERPIETLWDVTVAATAHARSIPNNDKRLEIERAAGELLKLAA